MQRQHNASKESKLPPSPVEAEQRKSGEWKEEGEKGRKGKLDGFEWASERIPFPNSRNRFYHGDTYSTRKALGSPAFSSCKPQVWRTFNMDLSIGKLTRSCLIAFKSFIFLCHIYSFCVYISPCSGSSPRQTEMEVMAIHGM